MSESKSNSPVANKKIEEINRLEDLKMYLCPRSNWNPWVCVDCESVKNCKAGQRARLLLDRETNPNNSEGIRVDKTKKRLFDALTSEDPIKWLRENAGMQGRHAATEFLRIGKNKYPDIVKIANDKNCSAWSAKKGEEQEKAQEEKKAVENLTAKSAETKAKDPEEDDLVSLDEILRETETSELAEPEEASAVSEDNPEVSEESVEAPATPSNEEVKAEENTKTAADDIPQQDGDLKSQINRQYEKFKIRRAELEAERDDRKKKEEEEYLAKIKAIDLEYQDRIAEMEEDIKALARVARMKF